MMNITGRSMSQSIDLKDDRPDGNPRGSYRITRSVYSHDKGEDITVLLAGERWTVYHDEPGNMGGAHSVGFHGQYQTAADALNAVWDHDKEMTFTVSKREHVIPECPHR